MLMHIHRLLSQKENSRFSRTLLFYATIFLLMLLQLPRGNVGVNCEDFCEGERDRWRKKDDPNGVFMFECEQYTNWIDQMACLDNCDCVRKETTVTNCVNGKFTCAKKKINYKPPKPTRYDDREPDHYRGHDEDGVTGSLLMVIFVFIIFPCCCYCVCACIYVFIKYKQAQDDVPYTPPVVALPMPVTGIKYARPQIIEIDSSAPASSSVSTTV